VIQSNSSKFAVGDFVLASCGWVDHFICSDSTKLPFGPVTKLGLPQNLLSHALGLLGVTGYARSCYSVIVGLILYFIMHLKLHKFDYNYSQTSSTGQCINKLFYKGHSKVTQDFLLYLRPPKEDNLSIRDRMALFNVAPKWSSSRRFRCTALHCHAFDIAMSEKPSTLKLMWRLIIKT